MTASQSSDSVLSMEDVEVHFEEDTGLFNLFDEPDVVRAVDGVSLDIEESDVVALVGESGCGKTTLGKAAVGLQNPTGGSIKYRGQDIQEAKNGRNSDIEFDQIRKSLQIIHQDPGSAINPNKRVIKSLELPLKKWQPELRTEQRRERIYDLFETVGMSPPEDYANRYPHQLSGGEQQRIVLIRSLLLNPDLILADEAISALDVSLRIDTMDLFLKLQEEFNTSYLFISHDLSNARYLAEKANGRIGVMYLGQLVEIGSPNEIIQNPTHPYTQALKWATPDLYPDRDEGLPLRKIDVPDPINPPSGCRFHTRCPEAHEICRTDEPPMFDLTDDHRTACYRADKDHRYWDSPELDDVNK